MTHALQISGKISYSYSYSMKWYSYSIVHPIEYEYEYCPSAGVRVRKPQGIGVSRLKMWVKPRALAAFCFPTGKTCLSQIAPAEMGTPQGAVISPLLANVFLHYVLDLWIEQWRHQDQFDSSVSSFVGCDKITQTVDATTKVIPSMLPTVGIRCSINHLTKAATTT